MELFTILFEAHGLLIGGSDLIKALGYPSGSAFRQSIARKSIPIDVFNIEKRRGKFALVTDLARWLAEQKLKPSEVNL